jgi:hypothetical protein
MAAVLMGVGGAVAARPRSTATATTATATTASSARGASSRTSAQQSSSRIGGGGVLALTTTPFRAPLGTTRPARRGLSIRAKAIEEPKPPTTPYRGALFPGVEVPELGADAWRSISSIFPWGNGAPVTVGLVGCSLPGVSGWFIHMDYTGCHQLKWMRVLRGS